MRSVGLLVSSLGFVVLFACGGGGDSRPPNNPPNNPPTNPPTQPPVTNPCAAASLVDGDFSVPLEVNPAAGRKRARQANRTPRVDVAELLWTHEASRALGPHAGARRQPARR